MEHLQTTIKQCVWVLSGLLSIVIFLQEDKIERAVSTIDSIFPSQHLYVWYKAQQVESRFSYNPNNNFNHNHNLRGLPLVENSHISNLFDELFSDKSHGVYVLISPPGSGKTTYATQAILRHQTKKGLGMLIASAPRTEGEFLGNFGVDSLDMLFKVLPEFAVVILDQFDSMDNLSSNIKSLILQIGIRSRNSKRGSFVICVSNIEVADAILILNGGEKIRQYGNVSDFRWDSKSVQGFVENCCEKRAKDENDVILRLGNIAQSPGFLYDIVTRRPNDFTKMIPEFESKATTKQKIWKEFEEHKF